jgi:hypothetical protein
MANVCGTLGANTGKPQCDVPLGSIKYSLFTQGWEPSEEDLQDSNSLKAAMLAAMKQVRGTSGKLYLFPYVNESEDATGDPVRATLADGFEKTLLDPIPKYTMRSGAVGFAQNQAMCAFNGFSGKTYIIDSNNRFAYRIKSNNGGKGFGVGDVYTNAPKFGNTAAINVVATRIAFSSNDELKLPAIGLIQLDFNIADLINIEDIQMVEKAAQATNVFTIGGKAVYSGQDIYSAYSSALAATARWNVRRMDTDVALTLTSVAADANNKGWDITVDSTEYTGLPSGTKISINIKDPATLYAAGVEGIEGIQIIYEKP